MPSAKPITVVGIPFQSFAEACRFFGKSQKTVYDRLKYGWDVGESFLLTPKRTNNVTNMPKTCVIAGVEKSVRDHCLFYGISTGAARMRVSRGMSVAQAITTPCLRKWKDAEFSLYTMTCGFTLKTYVGITRKPETRLLTHWRDRTNRHKKDNPLYLAMKQYGLFSFSFDVVETFTDHVLMCDAERRLIAERDTLWPNGYNLSSGGEYMASHITGYEVLGQMFDCKQDALDHYGITEWMLKHRRKNGWSDVDVWTHPLRKRRVLKNEKRN